MQTKRLGPIRSLTLLQRTVRYLKIVLANMWAQAEGKFSLLVLGVWVCVALLSCLWTPQPLESTDGYQIWQPPSRTHILGTDGTGADVLSWLLAGSATNLLICLLTVLFSGIIGTLLVSATVSRVKGLSDVSIVIVDTLISIPTVLIALILVVPMGASVAVIVLACGLGYGLNLARVVRPQALLAAGSDYVFSAVASGARGYQIFFRHILPNVVQPMIIQLSLSAATSVLAESGLTYLGVGVPVGMPSWGHSLTTSAKFITVFPLTVVWPGLCVTVAVVALNLFGDALRTAVDPLLNTSLREVV